MSFSFIELALIGLAYLSCLFALAHATEKGWLPRRWSRHPLTYTLSLGVFAGAWAVYGALGMAYEYGYGYLAYYLGICGSFLLAPVLLHPILRITRAYQLTSLADLFAFRYRSQWAGTLVTLCSAAAILSLLSLQIQAVTTSIQILVPDAPKSMLAAFFCAVVVLFAVLFGARRGTGMEHHEGLVMAIAFDALFKLVALFTLGAVVLFSVFGGLDGLDQWLQAQAPRISAFERRLGDGGWRALLLMSFAAALVMPHMFHMTFTESASPRGLSKASWGLPLYLLLLALPIPILLWGGIQLAAPTGPAFYPIGIAMALDHPALAILAYLAGTSAASGLMIVLTLALAGMVLNHVVLPLRPPLEKQNIYAWLRWVRRLLIGVIILLALAFHEWLGSSLDLALLGVLGFSGALQLLPGALGVIFWPEGNRRGVIAGMLVGIVIWLVTLVLPFTFHINLFEWAGLSLPYPIERGNWHIFIFGALTLNIAVFALVSMLTPTSTEETSTAQACSLGALSRPKRRELTATSSEDFKKQLTPPLGESVARREVERALAQLHLPDVEYRPYQLRRLRDQIEVNLSGLMGPGVALDIVKRYLGYKPLTGNDPAHDIHYVERTLEAYQTRLTGLAAQLDSLRRHYRQTLQNLPIAACSIGSDGEVLMWNQAMAELTGVQADIITGATLVSLPEPWGDLLAAFADGEQLHIYKHRMDIKGRPHWFNLHKSAIAGPDHPEGGSVLLVEDQTETRLLEDELIHSERLASVGRLAAGVAHEVGNPVTGIACLAQNMKLETEEAGVLESADQILQQTQRISRILESMMNFARSGNHQPSAPHEPANVARCIQEAINLLSLSDKERQIQYDNLVADDLEVIGDEQRLVQVFINLLGNARDASPDGAHITISGKREGYSAIIEVLDEGCGIPADQLDHIFEPFYTTKGPSQGTGLGLSLVYSIIEEHYGTIQVDSPALPEKGQGTRVTLKLPANLPDDQDAIKPEDQEFSQ
ncbi:ATP-binding protein [Marinobacteraceae bacterium S3BR75-40.1]